MSTADILAVTGLAWPAVTLVLGLKVIPQLRMSAPQQPKVPAAAEQAAVESIAAARKGAA